MNPLPITASTIVSAMGRGMSETLVALKARRTGLRPCDFGQTTSGHIGRVDGLEEHRLPAPLRKFDCRNNRLADVALRTDGFAEAVDAARARYGAERIAVVLGTSTSGVLSCENAYAQRDDNGALPDDFDYEHTHDISSLARFVRTALELRGPALVVSTACASSSKSLIDAYHLIASGICDAAIVGGVDSLCGMTLQGFAALDLISSTPCNPCDEMRGGISIGEAAGFALLQRSSHGEASFSLLGYGATSDGYHMSSPHPGGAGAIGAMREALTSAGLTPDRIDYINLHGTGTRANDAMEDLAVSEVFGTYTPCSSTKGWSGHTLGASGILELAVARLCIENGFVPGCLAVTNVDPSFRSQVLTENSERPVRRVMSNSFGFGGINCSLIVGTA
jgi:3-oxoacyl-[acyl-carrier-protein] synthase I